MLRNEESSGVYDRFDESVGIETAFWFNALSRIVYKFGRTVGDLISVSSILNMVVVIMIERSDDNVISIFRI